MDKYIISCCSTCDLDLNFFRKRNVVYSCFHFTLGDKEYEDNFGQSIPLDEFYQKMEEGLMTKTSQINVAQFEEHFEKYLKDGYDILHITLSSGISGVLNSAMAARESMLEKYPDRKIVVVDSLLASSGYGLLVDYLADKRDSGVDFDRLCEIAEEKRYDFHAWFFSTDLKYYVRGGRVSKASGFIGQALHICPMLHMDQLGRLIPVAKIISKRRAKRDIVRRMKDNCVGGLNYNGKCFISHSACLADAKDVAKEIEETFPNLNGKVEIYPIGTTIGCHTGPGTIAVFFEGKRRED